MANIDKHKKAVCLVLDNRMVTFYSSTGDYIPEYCGFPEKSLIEELREKNVKILSFDSPIEEIMEEYKNCLDYISSDFMWRCMDKEIIPDFEIFSEDNCDDSRIILFNELISMKALGIKDYHYQFILFAKEQ